MSDIFFAFFIFIIIPHETPGPRPSQSSVDPIVPFSIPKSTVFTPLEKYGQVKTGSAPQVWGKDFSKKWNHHLEMEDDFPMKIKKDISLWYRHVQVYPQSPSTVVKFNEGRARCKLAVPHAKRMFQQIWTELPKRSFSCWVFCNGIFPSLPEAVWFACGNML